jgi:hypothetical protein
VKDEVVFYLRGVPKLSRDQFKAACAKRGKNMREVAIALFQLFAETVDVSVFVPGEERKWLEKILKRIEQNRRGKKKLRDERSTSSASTRTGGSPTRAGRVTGDPTP